MTTDLAHDNDFIIVGGGTAGLSLARSLFDAGKRVLVIEQGVDHSARIGEVRFAWKYYDHMALGPRSTSGLPIYRALCVGGTSVVNGGNAVPAGIETLKKNGIDLTKDIEEVSRDLCVSSSHFPIGKITRKIMDTATGLGFEMKPMPKFAKATGKCVSCGNCLMGCRFGAKWDSRDFIRGIDSPRLTLLPDTKALKIAQKNGRAIGVEAVSKNRAAVFYGDKIVVAAGGLGTPRILLDSGIDDAGEDLFVDFFQVTYGSLPERSTQAREVTMNCVYQDRRGFILSPLLDNFVGLFSTVRLNQLPMIPAPNLVGIMTKIKDTPQGKVHRNGKIEKNVTAEDKEKLKAGELISGHILLRMGAKPASLFTTIARGAHPGGTAKIGKVVDTNLETRVKNLFVCDTSVFPDSLGLPPILTLIALTKWFARKNLS